MTHLSNFYLIYISFLSHCLIYRSASPDDLLVSLTAAYEPVTLLLWGIPSERVTVDLLGIECSDDCDNSLNIADDLSQVRLYRVGIVAI